MKCFLKQDNNQHIKNFFLHLKEKDKRNLPTTIKFILFPDKMTDNDFKFIKYKINPIHRSNVFNTLIKENEKYYLVKEFDSVVPSLAVAYAHSKYGYGYYTVFIDIDGNKSVKGANFSNLRFNFFKQKFLKTFTTYEETIMAYLNSIQFKYIHFDLDIDDNLIVSNKTEYEIDKNQKVITSHNPICVNEMGYPDPYFEPKDEQEELIKDYTIFYLNEIKAADDDK